MLKIALTEPPVPIAHVTLSGTLDTSTASELQAFIDEQITAGVNALVLDMEALIFIASEGLRVLAKARKMMRLRGGHTYFVNLSRQVRKVFEIVHAAPVDEIFNNTDELDAYLADMQKRVGD